jgi:flagellar M-ring protein FliF
VSVQNNLPNADAGSQGAGNQEQRQEETVNYEIGKSVRTVAREQPRLERLSVAVMVDGIETVGADGKRDWKPRSDEEIARIAALVKSAVGYDEKRGDTVEVATMRFASEAAPDADAGGWLGARLEKADLVKLAQTALFGVVGLLALLLVLRPMVARLTALAPPLPAAGGAGAGGAELTPAILAAVAQGDFSQLPPGLALPAPLAARAAAALGGPGAALALGGPAAEDDAMVSMAQIEGQLRAASIRKLAELVDKHPDETVSIVRGWMAQDHA